MAKHLRDPEYPIKKESIDDRRWRVHAATEYPVDVFNHGLEFTEDDHIKPYEPLPVEISRGCIFKCSFCAFPLNGKRRDEYIRDYDKVREEMVRNYEMFGTTNYIFSDDTINDSMDKVDALHALSASLPFDLKFTGYIRLDVMYRHPDMAHKLMDMGLESAFFGIETLNAEAARRIGKGGANIKEAMYWIRDVWGDNVLMRGAFIIGLHPEPFDSVLATREWTLSDDYPLHNTYWSALRVFGNSDSTVPKLYLSRMEKDPEKFGLEKDRENWVSEGNEWSDLHQLAFDWNQNDMSLPLAGLNYRSRTNVIRPEIKTTELVTQQQLNDMGYGTRVNAEVDEYITNVLASR